MLSDQLTNGQKWEANKVIKDSKTYSVKLEECLNRWFFQSTFESTSSPCAIIKNQFDGKSGALNWYSQFGDYNAPLTTQEKNFNAAYNKFQKDCNGRDTIDSYSGLWILGGMLSTTFSLTIPWFAYIGYASWNDPLGCFNFHKIPFIITSSVSGLTFAGGVGMITYGKHLMDACKAHNNDDVVQAFLDYVNTLKEYEYAPIPAPVTPPHTNVTDTNSTIIYPIDSCLVGHNCTGLANDTSLHNTTTSHANSTAINSTYDEL